MLLLPVVSLPPAKLPSATLNEPLVLFCSACRTFAVLLIPETFLAATVGDVDAVIVDQHGHAAEGSDAIGDDDGVHFMGSVADGFGGVEHAARILIERSRTDSRIVNAGRVAKQSNIANARIVGAAGIES